MDIQAKLGGGVKICFYFGYKLDILRDDRLKCGRTIQCSPTNDIMMKSFDNIHYYE